MAAENGETKVQVFDTEEDLSIALAKYTAELSEKFINQKGKFTVVLSGGYLINSLRKLTESPFLDSIDWSNWHVFWLDERVVPKSHPDSNYLLAYEGFLKKTLILPDHVYAINDSLSSPEEAAEDYEKQLKDSVEKRILDLSKSSGFPKFDLMLLGMGPDGHVASLFPGHPLLKEKEKLVTFIKDSPKPPPERITMTFPVINSSDEIVVVVAGDGEVDAVEKVLGGNQSTDPLLPAQMVSPEGKLVWFLDRDAAAKLEAFE